MSTLLKELVGFPGENGPPKEFGRIIEPTLGFTPTFVGDIITVLAFTPVLYFDSMLSNLSPLPDGP
jgi:hypothetical protein